MSEVNLLGHVFDPLWSRVDEEIMETHGLAEEPGIVGIVCRRTAPGAMPPGTRVEKVASETGDFHQDGSRGTILGSIGGPAMAHALEPSGVMYFIAWDDLPNHSVASRACTVRRVEEGT